jgi:hypothetical protein
MTENFYDIKTAAELAGRSPGTVRQLARARGIGKRMGRDWVFTDADIERLRAIPKPERLIKKVDRSPRRKR